MSEHSKATKLTLLAVLLVTHLDGTRDITPHLTTHECAVLRNSILGRDPSDKEKDNYVQLADGSYDPSQVESAECLK